MAQFRVDEGTLPARCPGMDHSSFFSCFWFVETGRCLRLRDEATVYDEIYGRGVSAVSSLDSSLLEVEEFYTVLPWWNFIEARMKQ